jgi:hypothetical protein
MPRGGARLGAGRKPGNSEITALIEALRPVRVGRNGYTRLDRYRDFKTAFNSDAGKRVLAQIVDLCEGPITTETDLTNHALLAARAWTRRVGNLIVGYASVPPSIEPTTETKDGKEELDRRGNPS